METWSRPAGRSLVLAAVLLLALAGCGGSEDSADPMALARMFEPVCAGEPLAEAAEYPDGGTPHLLGVVNEVDEQELAWVSDDWSATSVDEVQLVACFAIAEDVQQVCDYRGGSTGQGQLERIQYTFEVTLREARTADEIDATTIEGEPPDDCPSSFTSPGPMLSHMPWEEFSDWLEEVAYSR